MIQIKRIEIKFRLKLRGENGKKRNNLGLKRGKRKKKYPNILNFHS